MSFFSRGRRTRVVTIAAMGFNLHGELAPAGGCEANRSLQQCLGEPQPECLAFLNAESRLLVSEAKCQLFRMVC
jgi:hypothetical protein